ncbi:hypothetical protein ROHU_004688 [Labeo rohita]|uniref:Uncharacterized protein n=1 Tax=Labeo rohita TaxID=84645 RepID=A0A498NJV1_LABRO|nr:hypothetical protein ROHU_004688 [Labeo rohita]
MGILHLASGSIAILKSIKRIMVLVNWMKRSISAGTTRPRQLILDSNSTDKIPGGAEDRRPLTFFFNEVYEDKLVLGCNEVIGLYTELSKPLTEALKGGKPRMELIIWTEEMEEAFVSIKETLSTCPALRHADAGKVGIKSYSTALGQRVPGRTFYGMVGYYSTPIPISMAGQHPCLLICDSAEWAVKASEEIIAH